MRVSKSIIIFLTSVILLHLMVGLCSAEPPEKVEALNDLIEKAAQLDNREIEIKGEVVGEILRRGDQVWLNISDGNTTIGAWGESRLGDLVKNTGDYQHRGDTVRVMGVFSREDKSQGGELCLHMTALTVTEKGEFVAYSADHTRMIRTGISFIAALGFYILLSRRNKQQ